MMIHKQQHVPQETQGSDEVTKKAVNKKDIVLIDSQERQEVIKKAVTNRCHLLIVSVLG